MTTRRVGRPRLLSREKIVEAANRMPPGELTMSRVAEVLGVSAGALYQYVADRDELIRLVIAERLRVLPVPSDTGQHWSGYLREYAAGLTAVLSADTSALIQVLGIESTLVPELRLTEAFYQALVSRGFALDEAVEIHAQVSVIAMGAAMAASRERIAAPPETGTGAETAPGTAPASLARALDGLDDDDLPLVRKAASVWKNRSAGVHEALTGALIEQIARKRGERIDNARE